MVMLQTATRVVRSASGRLIRRFTGTLAASDNVTQGTWIIVAVALAVLVVGLIAVPGFPDPRLALQPDQLDHVDLGLTWPRFPTRRRIRLRVGGWPAASAVRPGIAFCRERSA